MVSKTRMLDLVTGLHARDVAAGFAENPSLLGFRDDQGRSWLHLCCGASPKRKTLKASARIRTAEILLDAGLGIDDAAFREGKWRATPLWYTIARGRCLPVAKFLLDRGADPNHCLWAAGYNDDLAAIKLVVAKGADVDPVQDGHTPFLAAVQWSRFKAAKVLLELGANPDYKDDRGMTALHYMLKKGSDARHFETLIAHGARVDIPDATGATAAQLLTRKRSPAFRKLAGRFAVR